MHLLACLISKFSQQFQLLLKKKLRTIFLFLVNLFSPHISHINSMSFYMFIISCAPHLEIPGPATAMSNRDFTVPYTDSIMSSRIYNAIERHYTTLKRHYITLEGLYNTLMWHYNTAKTLHHLRVTIQYF